MTALQRELLRRGVFLAATGAGFISTVTTEADLEMMAAALREALAELPQREETT
jgi:glutamate-1-semialdehyde aminotransferase